MKTIAVYLLRFFLSAVLLIALFVGLLKAGRVIIWYYEYLIALMEQIDIFHNLVYAGLCITVISVVFTERRRFLREQSRRWRRASLVYVLVLVGILPIVAVALARPSAVFSWQLFAGMTYFLLNILLFQVGVVLITRDPRWGNRVRRAVGLADLVAPLVVWAAYREQDPRRLRGLQILPLLLMVSVMFVPYVVWPIADSEPRFDRALRRLSGQSSVERYQLDVDPADGELVAADNDHGLLKISPTSGKETHAVTINPFRDQIEGFGIAPKAREIAFFDFCAGIIWIFDESDLHVKRTITFGDHQRYQEPNYCYGFHGEQVIPGPFRVLWDSARGVFVAFTYLAPGCLIGPADHPSAADVHIILDPTSGIELHNIADAALDLEHRRLHIIYVGPALAEYDVDQQRIIRVLALPSDPQRIALDARRRLLFITIPILGQVWVVDAATYRRLATINTFPGVRVITLDPDNDRFFLGGFSPLLEVRSLTDFSLQNRIYAPPWMRWIAVDAKREKAYLTSYYRLPSICALDLVQLRNEKWEAFWAKIDPCYPFFRMIGVLMRPLIVLVSKPLAHLFS
jgi:hypothetical protein